MKLMIPAGSFHTSRCTIGKESTKAQTLGTNGCAKALLHMRYMLRKHTRSNKHVRMYGILQRQKNRDSQSQKDKSTNSLTIAGNV